MKVLQYDGTKYNFQTMVSSYLECTELNRVHEYFNIDYILDTDNQQKTEIHKKFYSMMDDNPLFINIYESFIKNVIANEYSEDIVYQRYPTLRVHLPNNRSVHPWHKDKYFNISPNGCNWFLPITDTFDTNTLWIEQTEDEADYQPLVSKYGQVIEWNGANLKHGCHFNETGVSRISFDFRVVLSSDYDDMLIHLKDKISSSQKVEFTTEGYYKK